MFLLLQFVVSFLAVSAMVALSGWARISRAAAPLDQMSARAVLADEFPEASIDGVWVAADGLSAVARSKDTALVVYQAGDGYVARSLPWAALVSHAPNTGRVNVKLGDFAAPTAVLVLSDKVAWPPVFADEGMPS